VKKLVATLFVFVATFAAPAAAWAAQAPKRY
jgi:hypothetical protein